MLAFENMESLFTCYQNLQYSREAHECSSGKAAVGILAKTMVLTSLYSQIFWTCWTTQHEKYGDTVSFSSLVILCVLRSLWPLKTSTGSNSFPL